MADINYLSMDVDGPNETNIPLGKIQNYKDQKASMLVPISFPGQDAARTEAIDTLGVIAYINIDGKWVGSFEEIQTRIREIKDIADGLQSDASMFRSPFANSRAVDGSFRIGNISTTTSSSASKLADSTAQFVTDGIFDNDYVKNLRTGAVANVTGVSETLLTLDSDIFTVTGDPYAVTASIGVKVLSLDATWVLPGQTICEYKLSLIQVNESGLR